MVKVHVIEYAIKTPRPIDTRIGRVSREAIKTRALCDETSRAWSRALTPSSPLFPPPIVDHSKPTLSTLFPPLSLTPLAYPLLTSGCIYMFFSRYHRLVPPKV